MLRCGRHKGKSFHEVARTDRPYCAWVLRLCSLGDDVSPGLSAFAAYLRREHGGVLPFGAHKGSFFDEMLKDHPDYCSWVVRLPDASHTMQAFADYIIEKRGGADESDTARAAT